MKHVETQKKAPVIGHVGLLSLLPIEVNDSIYGTIIDTFRLRWVRNYTHL